MYTTLSQSVLRLLSSKSYPHIVTGAASQQIATSVSAEIRPCRALLFFSEQLTVVWKYLCKLYPEQLLQGIFREAKVFQISLQCAFCSIEFVLGSYFI